VILTVILRAAKVPQGADETLPHQYTADPADAPVPARAGISFGAGSASGGSGTAGAAGTAGN
jgi:hypothetical protein